MPEERAEPEQPRAREQDREVRSKADAWSLSVRPALRHLVDLHRVDLDDPAAIPSEIEMVHALRQASYSSSAGRKITERNVRAALAGINLTPDRNLAATRSALATGFFLGLARLRRVD